MLVNGSRTEVRQTLEARRRSRIVCAARTKLASASLSSTLGRAVLDPRNNVQCNAAVAADEGLDRRAVAVARAAKGQGRTRSSVSHSRVVSLRDRTDDDGTTVHEASPTRGCTSHLREGETGLSTRRLVLDATVVPSALPPPALCTVCQVAPRERRMRCGHALACVCNACYASLTVDASGLVGRDAEEFLALASRTACPVCAGLEEEDDAELAAWAAGDR